MLVLVLVLVRLDGVALPPLLDDVDVDWEDTVREIVALL